MPSSPRKSHAWKKPLRVPKRYALSRFSVGRAAVLYKRGWSTLQVLDYYTQWYGLKYGMSSQEISDALFHERRGTSPNFRKRFEHKSPHQIHMAFARFMKQLEKRRSFGKKQMEKLKQDPVYKRKQKRGIRRVFRRPKYREEHAKRQQKTLERLRQQESFRIAQAKTARKRFKELWQDPIFREKAIEHAKKVLEEQRKKKKQEEK